MFVKVNRQGELGRHLRMVTGGVSNQRRLLNGSIDFNQTDTLANRYLRDLHSASFTREAGGSVSPSHNQHFGASMMIEGFTERAFDNLNQTM